MILQTILEGIGLGVLLVLVCAIGIRKGAVGMVHLYSQEVQERCVTLGLTTHAKIKRNALIFKAVCVPGYIAYVLVCVYALNGAKGFVQGFWQLLVILSVMNLIDRFWVDGYWVGHTNAWEIPGTEDLKPYITAKDKGKKWLFGTVGMTVISQHWRRLCRYLFTEGDTYMKYKIEKNTVQETLIIPLYARKVCSELYPNLYRDETAVRLIDEIDYDFSEAEKNSRSLMQRFGSLEVAVRQNDLAFEVRDYLKGHPNAAVVNLGCGLDSTGRSCDNGSCKIYNLDFPDVIAVRNELLPAGEREGNIPCNLNNTEWFRKIDSSNGAVFFASGVFYYFLTEQVKTLVQKMADAFPGSVLVFDAANRTAVKMIAKTWLKSAKIQDVGAYFAVSDAPQEISAWDSRLQVTSRGYMLGYTDLKDPSVSRFFRFLAKVGDGMMKMQIVKIRFGGKQ